MNWLPVTNCDLKRVGALNRLLTLVVLNCDTALSPAVFVTSLARRISQFGQYSLEFRFLVTTGDYALQVGNQHWTDNWQILIGH